MVAGDSVRKYTVYWARGWSGKKNWTVAPAFFLFLFCPTFLKWISRMRQKPRPIKSRSITCTISWSDAHLKTIRQGVQISRDGERHVPIGPTQITANTRPCSQWLYLQVLSSLSAFVWVNNSKKHSSRSTNTHPSKIVFCLVFRVLTCALIPLSISILLRFFQSFSNFKRLSPLFANNASSSIV